MPDAPQLRVGVIGLGRLWEARYKPALARASDRFEITALYDQVAQRATLEARALGCRAYDGLAELIESADVDVVFFLTSQWFNLYPLRLCFLAGKPVYCAVPVIAHLDEMAEIEQLAQRHKAVFMPEMPRRFYPVTTRLRALLAESLGRPRLIIGHARLHGFDRYGDPGPSRQLAPAPLLIDPGGNLIDWARFVVGEEPVELRGDSATMIPSPESAWGPDFQHLHLRFPGGAIAKLWIGRYHQFVWGDANHFLPRPGIQVFAESGAAWLEMPDRLQWGNAGGCHDERPAMEPTIGDVLCDQFYRLVLGLDHQAPTLDDALTLCRLMTPLLHEAHPVEAAPTRGT